MGEFEYEHIENKKSLAERHDAIVAIAAFATTGGGVVRVGIGPDGRRVGVQLGRTSLEEFANQIRMGTDPPQYPSISVEGSEESAVITVQVEESPIKPVWAFGKPYKRVGRTNQSLSRDETQRLVDATTGRGWDGLSCAGLTAEKLDRHAIEEYLTRAGLDTSTATACVLENLRLRLPDGTLCNAAALLFAEEPWQFLDGAQMKCGRFRGTASVDFLDERTFEGNVLSQLDQSLAFVARNIRQGIRITGRPEREIVPEYPDAAVREAVTNAICHRDYTAAGTGQVRIYDDRFEVWNPATLPADFSLEQLYHAHTSRPRNRKLAGTFYRARLIEQWGTGTLRMARALEEHGLPRPEYRYETGTFIVRFEAPILRSPESRLLDLNDRQKLAVAHASTVGPLTTKQYMEMFDISERQARRDLDVLVSHDLLRRDGRGPSSRYVYVA